MWYQQLTELNLFQINSLPCSAPPYCKYPSTLIIRDFTRCSIEETPIFWAKFEFTFWRFKSIFDLWRSHLIFWAITDVLRCAFLPPFVLSTQVSNFPSSSSGFVAKYVDGFAVWHSVSTDDDLGNVSSILQNILHLTWIVILSLSAFPDVLCTVLMRQFNRLPN